MSQTTFDWGAVINAIQQAIGTVIQAIASAIQSNATVIAQVMIGVGVVSLVWTAATRFVPGLTRLFSFLR